MVPASLAALDPARRFATLRTQRLDPESRRKKEGMYDEDTGEPILCPFCQSDDSCAHAAGAVDVTFGECYGEIASTWHDVRSAMEEAFLREMQRKPQAKPKWQNALLRKIWTQALQDSRPDVGEVDVPPQLFADFFEELLTERGFSSQSGVVDEAPGCSSTNIVFHAEDPVAACKEAVIAAKQLFAKEPRQK
jgi:hypothetical protein